MLYIQSHSFLFVELTISLGIECGSSTKEVIISSEFIAVWLKFKHSFSPAVIWVGFMVNKDACHSSTRLMSHKARGSSRLKRYLRWAFLTNFCEDKTYMSSSPWQTPGSVMFAFLALSEKRAWKALLSGEAYSREYLQRKHLAPLWHLPPNR